MDAILTSIVVATLFWAPVGWLLHKKNKVIQERAETLEKALLGHLKMELNGFHFEVGPDNRVHMLELPASAQCIATLSKTPGGVWAANLFTGWFSYRDLAFCAVCAAVAHEMKSREPEETDALGWESILDPDEMDRD